ncbi:MAG: oxidoreductase [Pseudomonadota bacterium]
MIRVGLIGYGLAGKAFHAPMIDAIPGMELAAVASSRKDEIAADWPRVRVLADAAALIADADIDLVVVAAPNPTHAPLAEAALNAGKHVVVDKPLALDAATGEALAALAVRRRRVLSVFHNRRWDSDFRTVRALVESGTLGDVALYEAHWDRFRPAIKQGWREVPAEGSGLLADLGPHLIDQALQLFGWPEAVEADVTAQRGEARVDDYFRVTLQYGTMRAVLSAASLVAAARPRFGVHGTGGSFVKFGLDPQEATLRAGGRPGDPGYGVEDAAIHGTLTRADGTIETVVSQAGAYRGFYAAMAEAIANGAPPPVAPADAVAGLRLIEAARVSAREGRRIALV